MFSTNPFADMSPHIEEAIKEAHDSGSTPEEISDDLGLDVEDVEFYLTNCLEDIPKSHQERLSKIVKDLESTCDSVAKAIDCPSPKAMMVQSYGKLMSEYRISLAELSELQSPEDVVDDIIERVFNPFVIGLLRVCTEETSKLSKEMKKLNVPHRDALGVSQDIFRRLSDRIQLQLPISRQGLDSYLGVKKDKRNRDLPSSTPEKTLQ